MKIVLTTLGSYGDVNPYLALGHGLKQRGHQVALVTGKPFRADVERVGLEFHPIGSQDQMPGEEEYIRIMDPRRGSEYVIQEYVMPHLRESYDALEKAAEGADLLVSHVITFAAPILAEKKKMRWVSTVLAPLSFFSAFDPPVMAPIPRFASVMRSLPPNVNRRILNFFKFASDGWTKPVQDLRRELGLPPSHYPLFDGQHSPYGALALFSSVFCPQQPDWPQPVKVCGFLFRDEDIAGRPPDPALERFLAEGPSPIAITLGSSAVNIAGDFYERAIAAAKISKRRAVVLAGEAAESLNRTHASPDILVLKSAPYHSLFPRCAMSIHQGGVGTLAQALRAGRPMIVFPFAHDQHDNAARAERLGVGKAVFSRSVSSELLSGWISEILQDSSMEQRADEIGKIIRSEDGVKSACDEIEKAGLN